MVSCISGLSLKVFGKTAKLVSDIISDINNWTYTFRRLNRDTALAHIFSLLLFYE